MKKFIKWLHKYDWSVELKILDAIGAGVAIASFLYFLLQFALKL